MAKKWTNKEVNSYLKTKKISQNDYVAPEVELGGSFRTQPINSVKSTVDALNSVGNTQTVKSTVSNVEPTVNTINNEDYNTLKKWTDKEVNSYLNSKKTTAKKYNAPTVQTGTIPEDKIDQVNALLNRTNNQDINNQTNQATTPKYTDVSNTKDDSKPKYFTKDGKLYKESFQSAYTDENGEHFVYDTKEIKDKNEKNRILSDKTIKLEDRSKKKDSRSFGEKVYDTTEKYVEKPIENAIKSIANPKKWINKGAFEDGYQFGDVTKSIGATAADIGKNVEQGFLQSKEGILDFATNMLARYYSKKGDYDTANYYKSLAQREMIKESGADQQNTLTRNISDVTNIVDAIKKGDMKRLAKSVGLAVLGNMDTTGITRTTIAATAPFLKKENRELLKQGYIPNLDKENKDVLNKFVEENSNLGQNAQGLAQGLGQLGDMYVTGSIGGAVGEGLGLSEKGVRALNTVNQSIKTWVGTAGSSMNEAYQNGATDDEALVFGLISGGGEALSELLSGGAGKGLNMIGGNKGALDLDDLIVKSLTKNLESAAGKNIVQLLVKSSGEGIEEILSNLASTWAKSITYMDDKTFKELINSEELMDEFIMGSLVSLVAQTPATVQGSLAGIDLTNENEINQLLDNNGNPIAETPEVQIQEQLQEDIQEDEERERVRQEVEENDIENDVNAFNLEENLEEDTDENYVQDSNENEDIEDLLLNLSRTEVTKDLENYAVENNIENLSKEDIQNFIEEAIEKENLNDENKELLRSKYNDLLEDYLKDQNKPKVPEQVKPLAEVSLEQNDTPKSTYKGNKLELKEDSKKGIRKPSEIAKDQYRVGNQLELQYKGFEDKSKTKLPKSAEAFLYENGKSNQDERNRRVEYVEPIIQRKGEVTTTLGNTPDNTRTRVRESAKAISLEAKKPFNQVKGNYQYVEHSNPLVDEFRRSAATYLKANPEAEAFVKVAEKIIKDKNLQIKFDPNLKSKDGRTANGSYGNGVITLNPTSNRAMEFLLMHEVTHSIASKEMIDMIKTYREGGIFGLNKNAEFDNAVNNLLKSYSKGEVNEEALADISGQLFGNQEFINNLAQDKPSAFKKIYNEIKYLWHQLRGYKNQNEFIQDLYNKWTDAYNNNFVKRNTTKSSKVTMSNQTDASGRQLSQQQAERYKNVSKYLRDENGNIIPMFHGTPNGEFTIFHPGSYFSPNKEYASGYEWEGASSISSGKGTTTPKTYEVYLNITNPFTIQDAKAKDIYINEYIKGGNSMYYDPYTDYTNTINNMDEIDWTEGEDLREWLKENHPEYDGLILDEGGDGGYGMAEYRWRGKSFMPFESNQIKDVDNLNPTDNDDIRYSKELANNNENVKSLEQRVSGDTLLDAQDLINEIKQVGANVDENGYVTVYHQTTNENAQKIKESGKMSGKENGIFFSTSKNASQAEGRGTTKLEFKIPAEKLLLDDLFSDNADVKIKSKVGEQVDISNYLVDNNKYSIEDNSNNQLRDKAKQELGTTNNPNEAGYLTSDGNYLDFSGKRQGASGGQRQMDHREIADIYDDEQYSAAENKYSNMGSATAILQDFMDRGNIRLNGSGVEIAIEPTQEQYDKLYDYLDHVQRDNGDVFIDLDTETNNRENLEYNSKTSISKMIKDIKNHYANIKNSVDTEGWNDYVGKTFTKDSSGNKLSKGKQEYFKDSKALDKNGDLQVVYHGTNHPGFTVFKPAQGNSAFGKYKFGNYDVNYFSASKDTARGYTNIGVEENNNIYEGYLNITNPYTVENSSPSNIKSWHNIKDNNIRQYETEYYDKFENKWNNDDKYIEDVIDELNEDLFPFNYELRYNDGYYELWDLGDNSLSSTESIALYVNDNSTTQDLFEEELKDAIYGESFDDYYYTSDDIAKWIITQNTLDGKNYDGIIIPNIMDNGPKGNMFGEPTTDYITFKPNQFKNINNENPTDNEDIRFSKENESWRDYLEREFPATGTRTSFDTATGRKTTKTTKTTTEEKTAEKQPQNESSNETKNDDVKQLLDRADKILKQLGYKEPAVQETLAYESMQKYVDTGRDTDFKDYFRADNGNIIARAKNGTYSVIDGDKFIVDGEKIPTDGRYKQTNSSMTRDLLDLNDNDFTDVKYSTEEGTDSTGKKVKLKQTADNVYERETKPTKNQIMPDTKNESVKIGDKKVSNFYSNITEKSKFITEENRESLKNNENLKYYDAITNKETLRDAMDRLDKNTEQSVGDFFTKENFTADDVATGWILMKRYQDAGNYEAMSNVIEKMREQGTKSGQAIQMLGMLDRLTPEGMEYYAQKQLDNAYNKFVENKSNKEIEKYANNFTLTAEEHQFIKDTMEKVAQMENEDDKKVEVAKIVKMLSDKLPPEKGSRIKAWMRISMLGNPKTQVRNVVGNAIIQPFNWLGDTVASQIDKVMSKKTGVRTKGNTDFGALAGGFIKGAKDAVRDAKLGIDTRDINLDRFEENIGAKPFYEGHKSKALNKGAKILNKTNSILGNIMSGGDRVFYQAIYDNSLKNQMKLNNTTVPTQQMMEIAEQEALSRTWNDSNSYTKAVLQIRNAMNKLNVKGYGLGDVLVPFAKTPANLTKAIVDYSPIGLVRSILQDGRNFKNSLENGQYTPELQHKFADSLGKGFAGTVLWTAAYALAKAGITSGASDDDKDVANFMRNTLGIQPYSVKIGNKSFTYDWAQPIAAPFAMMADIESQKQKSKDKQDLLTYIKTAGNTGLNILLDQSFLSSIQDVFNSYDGPGAAVQQQIQDLPARATPTLFKQIADLIDPKQRQTYVKGDELQTTKNKVQVKIPGASKSLTSQRDTLGREIKKYGGDDNKLKYAFNVFLNPANTNKGKTSEAAEEIYRVYKATGDKTVMPRQVGYSEYIDGKTQPLTAEERNEWQKKSGEKVEESIKALAQNKKYQAMSDEDKAEVINGIVNYSFAKAKSDIYGTQISTTYRTAAKKEEQGIPIYDYYVDRVSKRK